jgi:hypothetical protein
MDKTDIVFLSKFNYERLDFSPEFCYDKYMTQIKYKPYTISELVDEIYEDNLSHFDSAPNDCDCSIHITISTIIKYWE